jgi:hypothetical protein
LDKRVEEEPSGHRMTARLAGGLDRRGGGGRRRHHAACRRKRDGATMCATGWRTASAVFVTAGRRGRRVKVAHLHRPIQNRRFGEDSGCQAPWSCTPRCSEPGPPRSSSRASACCFAIASPSPRSRQTHQSRQAHQCRAAVMLVVGASTDPRRRRFLGCCRCRCRCSACCACEVGGSHLSVV